MRILTLGYSPCPNDTFIFYALAAGKIVCDEVSIDEVIRDVETLNIWALGLANEIGEIEPPLNVTKASFHAYGYLRDEYELLDSGSALGRGCGPLLIASDRVRDLEDLRGIGTQTSPGARTPKKIAIPGEFTTAHLLLKLFDAMEFPLRATTVVMRFDKIISAVSEGAVDAGLIIHESRFTYKTWGLVPILDLGQWWEDKTNMPIPLGAIIARKDLGADLIGNIAAAIKSSLMYAHSHRDEILNYILQHSQEVAPEVVNNHIALYVNDYTYSLGESGREAVDLLYKMADEQGLFLGKPQTRGSRGSRG
ncbi:1,4-dihydroxy-6-naphthoate synthase [Candidatus Omnitrophus magneticus]|uniref:1,4-dihydroxy-6-naphtoate synthase n=1 Tax=Candidatus Omnitrophus magneticus TaxID=1609969 RepID=A0A0F0CLA9_9BACT|nr:1,4-dihydroxy-6-naphthoate synthase [Candidatus Omnitrophus magneticus]